MDAFLLFAYGREQNVLRSLPYTLNRWAVLLPFQKQGYFVTEQIGFRKTIAGINKHSEDWVFTALQL
jgi:hypothetical protein